MANRSIKEIASATVLVAKEENAVAQVIDELKLFSQSLEMNQSLVHLLQDNLIDLDKRLQAIDKAAGSILHIYSKNTIALLIQNNHLSEFHSFLQAMETQARELASHYECTVITAVEINEATINEIKSTLEKKWNGTVKIQTRVDKSIIGGMVVKCGDWQFQSTIQSKLQQLHNHLVLN